MKKIHHICRCTGQQFTFEEWCSYLDAKRVAGIDTGKESVLQYHGFNFNVTDVCVTPNTPVDLSNRYCYVKIRTAQSPNGRWDYGKDYSTSKSGSHCAAGFIDMPNGGYATENEAILAALEEARRHFEQELPYCIKERDYDSGDNSDVVKPSAIAPYIRNMIKQIDDKRRELTFTQLALF